MLYLISNIPVVTSTTFIVKCYVVALSKLYIDPPCIIVGTHTISNADKDCEDQGTRGGDIRGMMTEKQ